MRLSHFETLKPVCPRCKALQQNFPLTLGQVFQRENDNILQGMLHCPSKDCQLEFPIIDGIPVIMPEMQTYLTENLYPILGRSDLSADIMSLLGDAAGPNSLFDATRQHLSSYGWSHYHDLLNPGEANDLVNSLNIGLDNLKLGSQPILDLGCSVGRTSFELAQRSAGLVLGIDANFSMLQVAQKLLHKGELQFPHRRSGIVYDEIVRDGLSFENSKQLDFWCCNALNLPFEDNSMGLVSGFNVFDAVTSPYDLLLSMRRVLIEGGKAIFTTPFDWSLSATPLHAWVGGHSQRRDHQGDPDVILINILNGQGVVPNPGFRLVKDVENIPWRLRIHDRHESSYKTHLYLCEAEEN